MKGGDVKIYFVAKLNPTRMLGLTSYTNIYYLIIHDELLISKKIIVPVL